MTDDREAAEELPRPADIADVLSQYVDKPSFVSYKITNETVMDKNAIQQSLLVKDKHLVMALSAFPPINQKQMMAVLEVVYNRKAGACGADGIDAPWARFVEDESMLGTWKRTMGF